MCHGDRVSVWGDGRFWMVVAVQQCECAPVVHGLPPGPAQADPAAASWGPLAASGSPPGSHVSKQVIPMSEQPWVMSVPYPATALAHPQGWRGSLGKCHRGKVRECPFRKDCMTTWFSKSSPLYLKLSTCHKFT